MLATSTSAKLLRSHETCTEAGDLCSFCCILCSGSSFLVTKKRLGSSILQIFMANAAPKLTRAVQTTCRTKKRQGQGAPRLQTNLATLQRETCPHMFHLTKRSCPPFSAPLQPCMTWRSQSSSHGPEHTGRSNGGLPSGEKRKSAYLRYSESCNIWRNTVPFKKLSPILMRCLRQ